MSTKENKENYLQLKAWIEDGWYDEFLPELIKALNGRRSNTLEVGKTVILDDGSAGASKYCVNGSEAIVIKVNEKSVRCKLTKLSPLAKKNGNASVGGIWIIDHRFLSVKN